MAGRPAKGLASADLATRAAAGWCRQVGRWPAVGWIQQEVGAVLVQRLRAWGQRRWGSTQSSTKPAARTGTSLCAAHTPGRAHPRLLPRERRPGAGLPLLLQAACHAPYRPTCMSTSAVSATLCSAERMSACRRHHACSSVSASGNMLPGVSVLPSPLALLPLVRPLPRLPPLPASPLSPAPLCASSSTPEAS